MKPLTYSFFIILLLKGIATNAQLKEENFTIKSEYLVTLPSLYDQSSEKQWPVLIFLHGSREDSTLDNVEKDSFSLKSKKDKNLPLIHIAPVNPYNKWSIDILNKMLDDVIAKYNVDTNRIYLSGHSLGGWGTWEWALENPERFAAIAPISGAIFGEIKNPWKLRHLPIWVFQGGKGENTDSSYNIETIELLKKYNSNAKITIYPNAGHGISDWPFEKNNLIDWMLNQGKDKALQNEYIVNKKEYESYCAIYTNHHKDSIQVFYENNQLKGKNKNGNFTLIPESEDMFFIKSVPWIGVEFKREQNKIVGLNILEEYSINFDKVD